MTQAGTDALGVAEAWLAEGRGVALATVISTWGSAPRQVGSMLVVRDDGTFAGSVSSGCVEGAVIEAALDTLKDGVIRNLEFGVADDTAWAAGLTCGGQITILVEPLHDKAMLEDLNRMRHAQQPVTRALDLASGESVLLNPHLDQSPLGIAARASANICAQFIDVAGSRWALTQHNPPIDLVLIGAVHIAQALTTMAAPLGYGIRIIDPRRTFATTERFGAVPLFTEYPDEVFAKFPLARHSAVVALAHDAKIDDPALIAALTSPAFYVGALGSKITQGARRERLAAQGISPDGIARLHGPIGLSIGSKSPAEIAISILAEIIQAQHRS